MSITTVLVVDDDANICEIARLYLEKEGYKVITSHNGKEAYETFKANSIGLIILDIMLPGIDGMQLCREIRKSSNVPIIMLTAKGETFDKVLGLEMGADDYIVKPFEAKELVARVRAVLRRYEGGSADAVKEIEYANLKVSLNTYELKVGGKSLDIPPKELELLHYLAAHPNRVFTREQLLEEVWGFDYFGDSRTVDVHIKRLREKVEGFESDWQIKTVWGVGYKFEVK